MTYKAIKKMKFKKKQNKVAEEIGIRAETISLIKNGKRQCSKYLAKALMNYVDGKFEDYFKEIN